MEQLAHAIVSAAHGIKDLVVNWVNGGAQLPSGEQMGLWTSVAGDIMGFFSELLGQISNTLGH